MRNKSCGIMYQQLQQQTISAGTAQHGIFMFDNNKKKRNAAAESGKANIQKNGYTILKCMKKCLSLFSSSILLLHSPVHQHQKKKKQN